MGTETEPPATELPPGDPKAIGSDRHMEALFDCWKAIANLTRNQQKSILGVLAILANDHPPIYTSTFLPDTKPIDSVKEFLKEHPEYPTERKP